MKLQSFYILFYVYGCFACMYVLVLHTCTAYRGQKRALNPLGLKLEMGVSHFVGSGNWTQVFWESSQCLTSEPSLQIHFSTFFTKLHSIKLECIVKVKIVYGNTFRANTSNITQNSIVKLKLASKKFNRKKN